MPLKLQISKIHQTLITRAFLLVEFGAFVIWWLNSTFQNELLFGFWNFPQTNVFIPVNDSRDGAGYGPYR